MRYPHGIVISTFAICGALAAGSPSLAHEGHREPGAAATVTRPQSSRPSFADLTERVAPAVVNISTRQRVQVPNFSPFAGTPFERFFNSPRGQRMREAQSLGSGFIVSADGYVVTNNHVITAQGRGRVEAITVTMQNGDEFPATLVGRDAASDLAVLKISAPSALPFVTLGDSRQAKVGDWVLAVGNPFGLGGTVTAGIVSAVYRNTGTGRAYDRYLQTDASINRGNSGGPMFDMSGKVIGINHAICSPTGGSVGIGFAIPSEIAAPIIAKLRAGEAIDRGYLGVTIQPVTEDLADSLGIPHNRGEFVQSVEAGEAAAEAGIQPGDVIVKVNHKDVARNRTLSYLIASTEPGQRVPIELIRNGQRMIVNATIRARPSEEELSRQSFTSGSPDPGHYDPAQRPGAGIIEKTLGLVVEPLTPAIAHQLGASDGTRGLVISAVDNSADAARKGLGRGDIILSANNREISTTAALEAEIRRAKNASRDALLLRVKSRGRSPLFVAVRLRE